MISRPLSESSVKATRGDPLATPDRVGSHDHSGDTILCDVKELFMPLTGIELFNKRNGCNMADHASARWTQHCCHGLTWDPWEYDNVWRVSQAFKAFMGFCRNLGVGRIF